MPGELYWVKLDDVLPEALMIVNRRSKALFLRLFEDGRAPLAAGVLLGALSTAVVVACSSSSNDAAPDVTTTPNDGGASSLTDAGAARTPDADTDANVNVEAGAGATPCWPYDRPSIAALRGAKKKVFAHYFSAFPLSLDNKPSDSDYYAVHYTRPEGENSKFYEGGGFLAERPVPQAPRAAGTDWLQLNMETEVRRAAAIGLDGFTYDLLAASGVHWDRLKALLRAIPVADPAFKIILTIDMTTSTFGGGSPIASDDVARKAFVDAVSAVASDPSLWHLPDGKLVLSAYYSSAAQKKRSAAFWKSTFDALAAKGVQVAFIPMPNGAWEQDTDDLVAAGVNVYAPTTWANRTVSSAPSNKDHAAKAHAKGLRWMSPIGPQDGRPKDRNYVEVFNTRAFRAGWDAAIAGDADLIQMITWSDYSESSEIAPSSKTQNAFYDLTGFYTTWFKTGAAPTIARDALYWSHRVNEVNVTVTKGGAYKAVNGPAGEDWIEVLGLLTAPGTLEISVGGQTKTQDVGAGVQAFRVPLAEGRPVFRLLRGGAEIVKVTSTFAVRGSSVEFFDPLYHAGSSMTCPLTP